MTVSFLFGFLGDFLFPPPGVLFRESERIFSVEEFGRYFLTIDFNNPEQSQNDLVRFTEQVENECPVASKFGISGTGEGIVWSFTFAGESIRFKVKGEKHSVSKVKKLAEVDPVKAANVQEFVEYAATQNRLEQGIQEVFRDSELDIKKLGQFIGWFVKDIITEEADVMEKSGLTKKDVSSKLANVARNHLLGLL